MVKEELIEPIRFFGPGECPICFSRLIVVDTESTIMELNKQGTPISEETVIRCKGICSNPSCNHKLEMVRWRGGYKPYYSRMFSYEMRRFKEDAENRVLVLNQTLKNPFDINN